MSESDLSVTMPTPAATLTTPPTPNVEQGALRGRVVDGELTGTRGVFVVTADA